MENDLTDEEKQHFLQEGMVELEPGIWGYAGDEGEHAEPNSKDYENMGTGHGYWIVGL